MKTSIIKYGLVFGVSLLLGFIASEWILGDSPDNFSISEVVGYTIMLVCAIAVIYGIKDFKESHNDGALSFKQGCLVGTGISGIAGLAFGIYMMVYLKWLNPEFTQTYMQYSEEQIRNSAQSEEIKHQQLAELASYADFMSNDFLQSLVMFFTVFLIGFLFTLVSSAAMKTPSTAE